MVTVATLLRGYHAGKTLVMSWGKGGARFPVFSAHRQGHRGFDCVRLAMSFFLLYSVQCTGSRFPPYPPLTITPSSFLGFPHLSTATSFFFSLFLPIPTKPRLGSVGGHVDRQLLLGKSCPLLHLFDGPGLVSRPSQIECRLVLSRV